MFYKETKDGQILQEGINEAGGVSSWIAAGTSYSNSNVEMIPFFVCYSMFQMQRTFDLIWAAADQRTRGFLMGGTAGRTTLNGEGLQHEDGHSHVMASLIPNCMSYDPALQFELAVIMQDGLRRMVEEQEDVFYYITMMNENYAHPEMPKGVEKDILKGMYLLKAGDKGKNPRVRLLGAGTILQEVIQAADLLKNDWNVDSDLYSCPSFTELARDYNECERQALFHPESEKPESFVSKMLNGSDAPVIVSTDYVRMYADQIRPAVKAPYRVLGTDGFGRSDTRAQLRKFFEVDRYYVVIAALKELADAGTIAQSVVTEAIKKYNIDVNKPNPLWV